MPQWEFLPGALSGTSRIVKLLSLLIYLEEHPGNCHSKVRNIICPV